MTLLKQKVYMLMKAYKRLGIDAKKTAIGRNKYHAEFLIAKFAQESFDGDKLDPPDDNYERAMLRIPNNKQIKAEGAKLIESIRKRDE